MASWGLKRLPCFVFKVNTIFNRPGVSGFGAPTKDLKSVYITFIRSVCEQSSNVWHSGLSLQNTEDLERIQKIALKIIVKEKYKDYQNALNILDLEELKDRREKLSLHFAQKCLRNNKMKHLFPPNNKNHQMKTRKAEHFNVFMPILKD